MGYSCRMAHSDTSGLTGYGSGGLTGLTASASQHFGCYMANDEHVALLKQGVEAWNEWRDENRDIRPNLREANLREANLRRANLREANLNGANLGGANLSGANLREAKLCEANLIEANLSEANLREANLF